MMVLITSECGEGSDEPACTHVLARAFASRINTVCMLKKTPNNFKTSSLSGQARMSDYKRLFRICDKTKSHFCMPFSQDPDTKPLSRLILIGDLLLLYQALKSNQFCHTDRI